jgi:hypothetical protein
VGRKSHGLIRGTIPTFPEGTEASHEELQTAGVLAEIQTRHPSYKSEALPLEPTCLVGTPPMDRNIMKICNSSKLGHYKKNFMHIEIICSKNFQRTCQKTPTTNPNVISGMKMIYIPT